MDNWLQNAAKHQVELEKTEYETWIKAYTHCKQLCKLFSFTSMSNGEILRLMDIENVLNKNIEYYQNELKK